MTLRVTILTLIACLLVATVTTIGALGYAVTNESVHELRDQYLDAVSEGSAKGIDALIRPALPLLSSIAVPDTFEEVISETEKQFIRELTARMELMPELTYLDYGDEQIGHYIGIRRDETGRLIVNRADVRVDAGHEFEWLWQGDGSLLPLPQPETPPYDPRTRAWYTLAAKQGFTWTNPFEFFSGGQGISASLPLKKQDGSLRGVISLAISLEHLAQYLKALRKDSRGDIFVLLRDGSLVASSAKDEYSETAAALRSARNAVRQGVEVLPIGTTIGSTALNGETYSVTLYPFSRPGHVQWIIAAVIPESEYLGIVSQNMQLAFVVGVLALALALGAGFLLSDRIATPLRMISADLERVAHFDLTSMIPPATVIKEVAVVGDAVAKMKAGLRSFSRFVPHEEIKKVLASGYDIRLGGEMRKLSLHFSDLASFSTFCESLLPTEVVKNLAEYLEILSEILHKHDGTIAQYTGDGVFAFFNAPTFDTQHATKAVQSALTIQYALAEINKERARNGAFIFTNRIGLHTAEVVVGHIGTENKLAYSAIGDGVNLASRLEGLNKIYHTSILASEATKIETDAFLWRPIDRVAVIGRSASTQIFEPVVERGHATAEQIAAVQQYESALQKYFTRDFINAAKLFSELSDGTSQVMAQRCSIFQKCPPPESWDGTFFPTGK